MATSAILSPTAYEFSRNFENLSKLSGTKQQPKPRLTLNTTTTPASRSLGRGTTALRLDTSAATSPTLRNTFSNAYEQVDGSLESPSSRRACAKRRATQNLPVDTASTISTIAEDTTDSRGDLDSSDTATPRRESMTRPPYSLSTDVRSILVNGPLLKRERPPSTPLDHKPAEGTQHCSRNPKKVCFREPLFEEIRNTYYLLRHSDLRSRSTSPATAFTTSLQTKPMTGQPTSFSNNVTPHGREVDVPQKQRHRQIEDDADEFLPTTPVARRHKKHREWVWTLGPLPGVATFGSLGFGAGLEEDLAASLGESIAAASAFNSSVG